MGAYYSTRGRDNMKKINHLRKLDHWTFFLILPFTLLGWKDQRFLIAVIVLWTIALVYDLWEHEQEKLNESSQKSDSGL